MLPAPIDKTATTALNKQRDPIVAAIVTASAVPDAVSPQITSTKPTTWALSTP